MCWAIGLGAKLIQAKKSVAYYGRGACTPLMLLMPCKLNSNQRCSVQFPVSALLLLS